jgi:nucleoside-diphosphate-sugar epimerase
VGAGLVHLLAEGHGAQADGGGAAGVARFVYTSALGARENHPVDFWRTKFEIEETLRESGLSHTILRPSAFMEWHVHRLNGQMLLDRGTTFIVGPGTKPRNFVSVRDIVPIALQALEADSLADRTIEIGGPDNLSNKDVALMYLVRMRQEHGKVRHLPLPLARVLATLIRPFHEGIARVLDMALVPDADWPEEFDPRALLAEFPLELLTVDRFVDERVREWRRARAGRR